jgi:hypothetical protein
VKRTGRDEPVWAVICICMETTQEIYLYSYLYLKLAKRQVSLIMFFVISSTKLVNRREEQVFMGEGRQGLFGTCEKGEVAEKE